MRNLKRINNTFPLNSPPDIKYNQGIFIHNNEKFCQGTVFSRSTSLIFRHYGVVYGIDKEQTLWLLELNLNGIEFVTYQDFMSNYSKCRIENYPKIGWAKINERANRRTIYNYNPRTNNCEAFINYLMYSDATSRQSEVVEVWAEVLLNTIFQMSYQSQPIEKQKEAIKSHTELMNRLRLNKLETTNNYFKLIE